MIHRRHCILILGLACTCLLLPAANAAEPAKKLTDKSPSWISLFDGKSMKGWKPTKFGGERDVTVKKPADQQPGQIVMEMGYPLTGVTLDRKFPVVDYELRFEAMKVDGDDFFCGITFPVGDHFCSFIVGGWAGAVVGLSSIDGKDASENETTKYMKFARSKWYKIRLRVQKDRIQTWIDEKPVVDQNIRGRKLSIRGEVDLSRPLGIAAYETTAALRKIEFRRLK